ncbi:hypothetical protein AXF42_Ash013754 [Apostasia shenzhenica]|uniref:Uncharacterized protein n=1 Tax=Apostasia shenzhenica TaxID=1088818 RepID=A0A2I0A4R1_9ASPA|nr:hypothetical protein AXF42_Ash013754 [Apostasia shenzhenica]
MDFNSISGADMINSDFCLGSRTPTWVYVGRLSEEGESMEPSSSSQKEDENRTSNSDSSSRSLFSPFAPGPEDLLLSTLPAKKKRKLSISVDEKKNSKSSSSLSFDLSAKNLLENFNEPAALRTPDALPPLKVFNNAAPDDNPHEGFSSPIRDCYLPLRLRYDIKRKLDL